MPNILLTGAGFSRNWGGLLASEVRTKIALKVEGDAYLRDLLQRHGNFEAALEEIQNDYRIGVNRDVAQQRLELFQGALSSTFDAMNAGFSRREFEFSNDRAFSVAEFLTRFDAIFTLNQDLLLERHYLWPPQKILLASATKLAGGELPGMEQLPDPAYHGDDAPLRARYRPKPAPFTLTPGFQPYMKLHGSTNWIAEDGRQLIVMGGDKPTTMDQYLILKWYKAKFAEYLSQPGAKLMVIGYGFRDLHINQLLIEAWRKSDFRMFVLAPEGRKILEMINATFAKPIYVREPLEEIVTYDSVRPLPSIFGGDQAELDTLIEFLK